MNQKSEKPGQPYENVSAAPASVPYKGAKQSGNIYIMSHTLKAYKIYGIIG